MDYGFDGRLEDAHLMDRKTKFKLEDVPLLQFEKYLSKFKEWISFKRDIRLNSLLDDKRVQFNIENISVFGMLDDTSDIPSSVAFVVKSMSFIIKNECVQELEIIWRPCSIGKTVTTSLGRTLIGLIEAGFYIDIKMKFLNDEFIYFYADVDTPKNVA
jgi:hypothetical protein